MLRSIRLGRATNSSSSHSIVFHPRNDARIDQTLSCDGLPTGDMMGRNSFTLRDRHAKAVFLLWSHFRSGGMNTAHAELAFRKVFGKLGLQAAFEEAKAADFDIEDDHPGRLSPPEGSGISMETWMKFLLSDQISYVAYDDNYDGAHAKIVAEGLAFEVKRMTKWRADGDAIVGMNLRTGDKIRWSERAYDKASAPELVDVKLTDACSYGCAFCYQGSTPEGQHAPLARIEAIFDELAEMCVFEIAAGGGEPAQHPDFARIIDMATDRGITFNFTAYGLDWTKNTAILDAIRRAKGIGIGMSVHKAADLMKVIRAQEALKEAGRMWDTSVIAQTVVGAVPEELMRETLWTASGARVPLLLLGYKATGRGVDFGQLEMSRDAMRELLEHARSETENARESYSNFHLSVDTAFLDQWGDLLDEMNVPAVLRASPEGKFSMYVDAVADTVGPSSYCDPSQMTPRENIRAQFAAY